MDLEFANPSSEQLRSEKGEGSREYRKRQTVHGRSEKEAASDSSRPDHGGEGDRERTTDSHVDHTTEKGLSEQVATEEQRKIKSTMNKKNRKSSDGHAEQPRSSGKKQRKKKGKSRHFTRKRATGRTKQAEKRGRPTKQKQLTSTGKGHKKTFSSERTMAPSKSALRVAATRASIEDILPDLRPKSRPPSKRASEMEKASSVVKSVVEPVKPFQCLRCQTRFPHYKELCTHKLACVGSNLKKSSQLLYPVRCNGSESHGPGPAPQQTPSEDHSGPPQTPPNGLNGEIARAPPADFSRYLSQAIKVVPETVFNNMHGSIKDVMTDDGELYRARNGSLRAVEKVRLNLSEPWTTKDVWESGGWEISPKILSWHRYEDAWTPDRKFLQRVSGLSWSEQKKMKQVFDLTLARSRGGRKRSQSATLVTSSSSESDSSAAKERQRREGRRAILTSGLDLKQTGRSVKYMSASEREDFAVKQASRQEVRFVGTLEGEWQIEQLFMCSTCAAVYDELREILHHKWEAHPYCLVAHVTFQAQLVLPHNGMMYPKLGRALMSPAAAAADSSPSTLVSRRGRRTTSKLTATAKKASSPGKQGTGTFPRLRCTKCDVSDFSSQAGFHEHLLICGGHPSYDESNAKGKKAKKRGPKSNGSKDEQPLDPQTIKEREEAAEKRRARLAKFEQPVISSRNTRLRTLEEEENKLKKSKTKKRRGRAPKNANSQPGKQPAKDPAHRKKRRQKGSVDTTETQSHSALPARTRRSRVNYSRDQSLRQSTSAVLHLPEKMTASVVAVVPDEVPPAKTGQKRRRASLDTNSAASAKRPRLATKRRASVDDISGYSAVKSVFSRQEHLSLDETKALSSSGTVASNKKKALPKASFPGRYSLDAKVKVMVDNEAEEVFDLTPAAVNEEEEGNQNSEAAAAAAASTESNPLVDDVVSREDRSPKVFTAMRRRAKRLSSAPVLLLSAAAESRVLFPLEVKLGALERIARGGETQTQVAQDLQCPVSTVASWWHRREALRARRKSDSSGSFSSTTSSSSSSSTCSTTSLSVLSSSSKDSNPIKSHGEGTSNGYCGPLSSPSSTPPAARAPSSSTALVPFQRNGILQAMRNAFHRVDNSPQPTPEGEQSKDNHLAAAEEKEVEESLKEKSASDEGKSKTTFHPSIPAGTAHPEPLEPSEPSAHTNPSLPSRTQSMNGTKKPTSNPIKANGLLFRNPHSLPET